MKYQIIGKNISITEGISLSCQKKLSRLDKFFSRSGEEINCRVVCSSHGETAKVEVTIFLSQVTLRAEVEHDDLYAAIDLAIDKLVGQIHKLKTRMDRSNGKLSFAESIDIDVSNPVSTTKDDVIVRAKSYHLIPMDIEEAIARMEALGHDFFLYLDKEDDRISVVYIRRDGGYGVIQAENLVK